DVPRGSVDRHVVEDAGALHPGTVRAVIDVEQVTPGAGVLRAAGDAEIAFGAVGGGDPASARHEVLSARAVRRTGARDVGVRVRDHDVRHTGNDDVQRVDVHRAAVSVGRGALLVDDDLAAA